MAPSMEPLERRRLSMCVMVVMQVLQARRRRLREERIRRARARLERYRRFQHRVRNERAIFLATVAKLMSDITPPPPPPAERRPWTVSHNSDWWDSNQTWTELEWLENLRITKGTFGFLCEELKEQLQNKTTKLLVPIPVNKCIALTLWKLATNAEYRTIVRVFGVDKDAVYTIVQEVCQAIVDQFSKRYVNFADAAGLRAIADGFERRWGLPQCVGAVDCIHVPILAPAANGPSNGQRNPSITAQIAVDDDYCITDLHVGDVDNVSDAEFFTATPLFRRGDDGTLFPQCATSPSPAENGTIDQHQRTIGGVDVPYFLAADDKFPLLSWVMTPYPEEPDQFGTEEESFNERLEDVHHVAQEAGTRLKSRWRCLQTRNDGDADFVRLVVHACCVLHNICERNRHPFLQEWVTGDGGDYAKVDISPPSSDVAAAEEWRSGTTEAQRIRRAIAGCAVLRHEMNGGDSPPLDVYEDNADVDSV